MDSKQVKVSIVVPVFNEDESIPELHQWIKQVVEKNKLSYEVLFVDDGSKDNSWKVIQDLAKRDSNVQGLKFNRNYGKSAALQTGFDHAVGEIVITMDADLQDSPDEVPDLIKMIEKEGYDLVSGWKKKRHDPLSKTVPSKLFNGVTRMVSGIPLHDFNCGLKAYKKEVVKNIEVYGEMHRYIPLIAKWSGFASIGEKVVDHKARKYGQTKFGSKRFFTGFLDLLSVTFVSRFRKNPMHFFGIFGTFFFLAGTIIAMWLIGEKLYNLSQQLPVREVVDQPLFFLALLAIVLGTQLFLAGFLAEIIIRVGHKKNDYLIIERTGNA